MTVGPLLENCCNPCCGDSGCNNKGTVNIMSTNPDCLRVDTSECGIIKLEPSCPKPTYLKAGDAIRLREVVPPDECYASGEECGIKGGWEINSSDEKVKACPDDTTPGTLIDKLEAGKGITISPIGCDDETNSTLKISINEDELPKCDIPDIEVVNDSNTVKLSVSGDDLHTITITDKTVETYDNMCCVGFKTTINKSVDISPITGNAVRPEFIDGWTIFTGNKDMATRQGIYILQDGYYRIFGQLTVKNNTSTNTYLNLGRGLLKITSTTRKINGQSEWFLSTAKHGAYGRQILFNAEGNVGIDNDGTISTNLSGGQNKNGFDGPWMTLNIDCLVDMKKGEYVTLGYRPQSDMPDSRNNRIASFAFVGADDSTTEYQALFGGTVLGAYMLAPKRFQAGTDSQVYENIL